MARTITARRSTRQDEGTKQRDLSDQPTPFVGLALAPFGALLVCWLVHYAIAGWTWHLFGHTIRVPGSAGYMTLANVVATGAAIILGVTAWRLSRHREETLRYALTASTTFIGLWLPFLIGVGPNRWLGIFFVMCAWIVAGVWAQPRLHVLRRDPREDKGDNDGEELIRSLGLIGYKAKGVPDVKYDDEGNPTRIDVVIKHRPGGTRKPLQDAAEVIESMLGTPEGFVRATPTESRKSNETRLTAVLQDPLVGRVPSPGLSHPGGSVTDPAVIGVYDDGDLVYVWACGGIHPVTGVKMAPTGYAFMGMTRSGKTMNENRFLLDGVISRRDGVILYLNHAKGTQDVQPIISGVEAALVSGQRSDYRDALVQVKKMMAYREKQLGRYGMSSWSSDKCFDNPPQTTLDGRAVPMEPMPALFVHVAEADSILEMAGEEAVFLASKAFSLGIIPGWSLQRWAATSMPTDLRFNIGTAICHGIGDEISAGFALSEPTIKAGAHPEFWKNRRPGMFYIENIGIDESRFAVPAKAIGDVSDEDLYDNMRRAAEEWGPRMAKLDKGSADATGGWWDKLARQTTVLRESMTPKPAPTAAQKPNPPAPDQEEHVKPRPYSPPFDAAPPTADEDPEDMEAHEEVRRDIAATTETATGDTIRGDLIRPDDTDGPDDDYYAEIAAANPRTVMPAPTGDDGIDLSDGKPEPKTRQEAERAFDEAVRQALTQFPDPADPSGRTAIIRTGQLQELYPYRARSWYSPLLAEMAAGTRMPPPDIRVEKLTDRTGEGWYRLIDTSGE